MGVLFQILGRHIRPRVKRDAERRSGACTVDPLRDDEGRKDAGWARNGQGSWARGLCKVASTARGG